MSVRVSAAVWQRSRAKASELVILLAIADWADDDGVAWPSMETLATKARISERGARNAVRLLEASGELSVRTGGIIDGVRRANTYQINLAMLRGQNVPPNDMGAISGSSRGQSPASTALQIAPHTSGTRHPETSDPDQAAAGNEKVLMKRWLELTRSKLRPAQLGQLQAAASEVGASEEQILSAMQDAAVRAGGSPFPYLLGFFKNWNKPRREHAAQLQMGTVKSSGEPSEYLEQAAYQNKLDNSPLDLLPGETEDEWVVRKGRH